MKTSVCNYHLNDPTTFLHYQIQVCSAHVRIIMWYKNLRASRAGARDFQKTVHKFKTGESMKTEIPKVATQRQ